MKVNKETLHEAWYAAFHTGTTGFSVLHFVIGVSLQNPDLLPKVYTFKKDTTLHAWDT